MKFLRFITAVILLLAALSAVPIVSFYISNTPLKADMNESVAKRLENLEGDRFAFIVIGDPESGLCLNEGSFLKVISNINREDRFKKVSLLSVFTTGDNVFRGKFYQYKIYKKFISLLKFPVISTPGNHDYDGGGEKYFKEFLGKNEFAFGSYNSYFIILDNNEGDVSDAQFEWLEKELKKSSTRSHRFVFMHKPPFNPYQQSWYRIETTPWPRRFMKLCED